MGDYQVKRKLLGGFDVRYGCEKCGETLRSPLDDAGQNDTCPTCSTRYVVPGQRELERERKRQQAARERAERDAQERRSEPSSVDDRRARKQRETEEATDAIQQIRASSGWSRSIDHVGRIPTYSGLNIVVLGLQALALLCIGAPIVVIVIALIQENTTVAGIAAASLLPAALIALLFAFAAEVLTAFREHVVNGWHIRRTIAQLAQQHKELENHSCD